MTTVNELISKAKYYIGYEEKASNANLEDFHANRGRNNYTKFQPLAGAGNGDYWCQYFIDGIAVEATGSIAKAEELLCMPSSKVMSGYTPACAGYFKKANRWYTTPQVGDIVYFYTSSLGRISHVGIVVSVNSAAKTFTTVEGNTSSMTFDRNGGCVGTHVYSYQNVGGRNRVNGFGRPRYSASASSQIGGSSYMFTCKEVKKGSVGNHVLLLQEIFKARGINGKDGKPLSLDGNAGDNTIYAINAYQSMRRKQGVELGTNGVSDSVCGPKCWADIIAL